MKKFFEYWRKGWKVWLMMFCINFSYILLFLPIAVIVGFLRGGSELYYIISAIIGLIFAPYITYFIFRLFFKESIQSTNIIKMEDRQVKTISITLLLTVLIILIFLGFLHVKITPVLSSIYERLGLALPIFAQLFFGITLFIRRYFILLSPLAMLLLIGLVVFEVNYKNYTRKIVLYTISLILLFFILLIYFLITFGTLHALLPMVSKLK